MRPTVLLSKTVNFLATHLRRVDHRYSIIAAINIIFMFVATDIFKGRREVEPYDWPIISLFGLAPFVTAWALIKAIRSYSSTPIASPQSSTNTEFQLIRSARLEDQLYAMKRVIDDQADRSFKKARFFELLGQLATVFSIGMPFSTWLYAFSQVSSKTKLEHLWPFIFSSTSFGFVAVTIAVTFLRHSKAHMADLLKFRAYSDALHKVRVALSTDKPSDVSATLDLLSKYAKFSGSSGTDETAPQASEEMKNAFTLASSLLSKS